MLYKSIGQGIDEWRTFMSEHFELYGGATTMQTARYTVDLLQLVSSLTSAATRLAAHGNPAARTPLADAALDLRSALDRLCDARDELLKAMRRHPRPVRLIFATFVTPLRLVEFQR